MRSHGRRIILLATVAAIPAVILALVLLWTGEYSAQVRWTGAFVVMAGLALGLVALHERVIRPLQTLSNMLGALREGDYSLRARRADQGDPLGLAYFEANLLADTLRSQRLGALEANALLRAVMMEIDAAVFAFDSDQTLRLVNRGGERLLGQPASRLLGRDAGTLGLAECLQGDPQRVLERGERPSSRWELRRTTFRQDGRPHELLVLTDVSATLQAEERQAWQRLIRVLSHEINNSLAPIRSLAGSLQSRLDRDTAAGSAGADLRQGLGIIEQRADALGRFMAAYARLARLPKPAAQPMVVDDWVRRVVALESRIPVEVTPGPSIVLAADGDQLDQLLINLLRNAADAVHEGGKSDSSASRVRVTWVEKDGGMELVVEDDGPGIADSANLFVPFYTTKPGGSGIGLALSRQIAEGHGGTLSLENRTERGCCARLWLPIRNAL